MRQFHILCVYAATLFTFLSAHAHATI